MSAVLPGIVKKENDDEDTKRAIDSIHTWFNYAIRFHDKKKFGFAFDEELLDINFTDDKHGALPIETAITSLNDIAFDTISNYKGFDPHKTSFRKSNAIYMAAVVGKEEYIQSLFNKHNVNPLSYCGGTLLSIAVEALHSFTILKNSFWKYEGETEPNPALTKKMHDFFYRTNEFAPKKFTKTRPAGETLPFPTEHKRIHAYYYGKTGSPDLPESHDIISILINHGVRLDVSVSGANRTIINLVENPNSAKDAFWNMQIPGHGRQVEYLRYEGNDVHQLSMQFTPFCHEEFVDIIVHYDMKPTKALILAAKENISSKEKQLAESYLKKAEDDRFMANEKDEAQRKLLAASVEITVETKLAASTAAFKKDVLDKTQAEVTKVNHAVAVVTATAVATKAKVDTLATQAAPVFKEHDEKQAQEARLKYVSDPTNPARKEFFEYVQKELTAQLEAYRCLSTGKMLRDDETPADYAKTILKGLGEHLPFGLSTIASGAASVIKYFSDKSVQARNKAMVRLLPVAYAPFSTEISLALTEWLDIYFPTLSLDKATALAQRTLAVVFEKLLISPESFKKTGVEKQFIHIVQMSTFFREHLEKMIKDALALRLKTINADPVQKAVFDRVQIKLAHFWKEEFGKYFAHIDNKEVAMDLPQIISSLQKLYPMLPNRQVANVNELYNAYLHQISDGTSKKILTPASLHLIAIRLTEMIVAQGGDLSILNKAAALKNTKTPAAAKIVAEANTVFSAIDRVADRALGSVFISLCVNENSQSNTNEAPAFHYSALDKNARDIIQAFNYYQPLLHCLITEPSLNPATNDSTLELAEMLRGIAQPLQASSPATRVPAKTYSELESIGGSYPVTSPVKILKDANTTTTAAQASTGSYTTLASTLASKEKVLDTGSSHFQAKQLSPKVVSMPPAATPGAQPMLHAYHTSQVAVDSAQVQAQAKANSTVRILAGAK